MAKFRHEEHRKSHVSGGCGLHGRLFHVTVTLARLSERQTVQREEHHKQGIPEACHFDLVVIGPPTLQCPKR